MTTLSKSVDALVVGAGPVGLITALGLARAGLSVEIIDCAWRSAAQSYACGLHASTLNLLASVGMDQSIGEASSVVENVAFYEGADRRAELHLRDPGATQPYLSVIPQDHLEELLENGLRELGIRVHWGCRLADLQIGTDSVSATIEKLVLTSVGYPFARSEEMVQSDARMEARYVVGADGSSSHVRQVLGIESQLCGSPWTYEIIEFDSLTPPVREVRITVGPGTADVFWPQHGTTCRWSLEIPGAHDTDPDHPIKERRSIVLLDDEPDARARASLTDRLRLRAPWFDAGIREIDWTTQVTFTPMVAKEFGRDRCWLAGDAGHQTSPIGMQSMNVGLREGLDLAARIASVLRDGKSSSTFDEYNRERQLEWSTLLGRGDKISSLPGSNAWVRNHRKRFLNWLPGSGSDLTAYLNQLGLALTTA